MLQPDNTTPPNILKLWLSLNCLLLRGGVKCMHSVRTSKSLWLQARTHRLAPQAFFQSIMQVHTLGGHEHVLVEHHNN